MISVYILVNCFCPVPEKTYIWPRMKFEDLHVDVQGYNNYYATK